MAIMFSEQVNNEVAKYRDSKCEFKQSYHVSVWVQ